MSGLTSQPSMGALVAALRDTSLDTGIDLQQAQNAPKFPAIAIIVTLLLGSRCLQLGALPLSSLL